MKRLYYIVTLALLALGVSSCADGNEPAPWQPATPSDAPGLYFTTEENILTVTAGEDTHVSIPVHRLNTAGDLTVPLIVESGHPSLIVPNEVKFADGEATADITLDLANIPTKELISLNITFPDDYINPYAAGKMAFEGSVIVSDWTPVTESGNVTIQWLDWSYNPTTLLDPIEQTMLTLPGTNRYRILNFLNSGVDFTFELKPSEYPLWLGYNRMIPLGNQVMYSQYDVQGYYNAWWLVTDDLMEWPEIELSSGGNPVTLYRSSFMWYDDEYQNEYCYVRLAGSVDANGRIAEVNTLYMVYYGFYTEDCSWDDFTGYMMLSITWP